MSAAVGLIRVRVHWRAAWPPESIQLVTFLAPARCTRSAKVAAGFAIRARTGVRQGTFHRG
jgi:hypothetical protein